jgi:integrase
MTDSNDHEQLRASWILSVELPSGAKLALKREPGDTEEELDRVMASMMQHLPDAKQTNHFGVPKASGKTIFDVWSDYKAEKIALGQQEGVKGGWKDGEDAAKNDYWPHISAFINLIGDKDIAQVTADDAARFKDHVRAASDGGSPKNKEKRLQRAGSVFRWAKSRRIISDSFDEFFRFPGRIEEKPFLKFETSDLRALFESDSYKKYLFKTPSEYWIPLLALFTGARLNELCQLTVGDIESVGGVETLSFLDEGGKRLKTAASRRIIPIHSKLIELGFLRYVATINAGRIFPELPENTKKQGDFSREPSRKFTEYRRRMGVGGDRLNPETGKWEGENRKAIHSFRSTFISALRKADVPKDRRTRLAGHDYEDTQDKHYTGGDVLTMFDFKTLRADVELVQFEVIFTPYHFE